MGAGRLPFYIMAKSQLTINARAFLEPALKVQRFKDKPLLLKTAAQHLLNWLRERHEAGANWEELKEVTIERKSRRGVAQNPEAILQETESMINTLSIRTRGERVFVGFPRDRAHQRTEDRVTNPINVNELVRIHSNGNVFLPIREVLGTPSNKVRADMVQLVQKEYNKLIREENKKKKK